MNWSAVGIVFRKELREFFRDRRALFVGIVLPILLYPVLTVFLTLMIGTQISKMTEEVYRIGVAPPERLPEVKAWYLEKQDAEARALMPRKTPGGSSPAGPAGTGTNPATPSPDIPGARLSEGKMPGDPQPMTAAVRSFNLQFEAVKTGDELAAIGRKDVKAIIQFLPPEDGAEFDANPSIAVLKESADMRSRVAAVYATGLVEFHRQEVVRAKLIELGGDPDKLLTPFEIDTSQDLSSREEKGGALFGGIVPFMLVIMLIGAASYPAIDVTTGERERGTMETLLIAPVLPRDLVTGKFLAVLSMAVLACVFNVLSLGFSMYFGGMGIMKQLDLAIPWMSLPWLLMLLLPLAILFSALLMLAGSFAASTKEAQTYLSPVIMLAMFPSMLAVVPGIELTGGWLFLPIGNVTLLSRDLLSGQVQFPDGFSKIAIVLGSTWLYAASVVGMAGALFGREEVLYGEKPWRVLLDRTRLKARSTPTAWEALFITGVALPLFIYAGMAFFVLMPGNILLGNVPTQVLAMIAWPVLYAWRSRSDLRVTLGLHRPPLKMLPGLPLLIVGSYLAAQLIALMTNALLPPDPGAEAMAQLIEQASRQFNLIEMLLLVAVTPAVCEEILFRGFLQQATQKAFGIRWAILLQAGVFAIFHQSLSRLPYTFALGLVLGIMAWRCGSILPGMVLHFVVNGLSVYFASPGGQAAGAALEAYTRPAHLPYVALLTAVLLIVGFVPMFLKQRNIGAAPSSADGSGGAAA